MNINKLIDIMNSVIISLHPVQSNVFHYSIDNLLLVHKNDIIIKLLEINSLSLQTVTLFALSNYLYYTVKSTENY